MALASQATAQDAEALRFARIISDHMVLQQQKPITLWGWAKPDAEVKVTMTQDTIIGKSAADKLGETFGAGKDNDAYTVTMRYVEKNPPKLEPRTLKARPAGMAAGVCNFRLQRPAFSPLGSLPSPASK